MTEKIICGDALEILKTLESESVDCCITSPPYFGLRDYGHEGQIGLEETPELYVQKLADVFREVKRVLKNEGTCWVNLGDSYAGGGKGQTREGSKDKKRGKTEGMKLKNSSKAFDGLKHKDLIGIPWRVAFALQADGWYLRSDIIWAKKNCMPESVVDRPTRSHEYIFLLSKSKKYHYDADAIKERAEYALSSGDHRPPGIVRDRLYGYDSKESILRGRTVEQTKNGITIRHPQGKHGNAQQSPKTLVEKRNKRSVWHIATHPYSEAHFATFPEKLVEPMVLAGCPEWGTVLDPFSGAATTGLVAKKLGRNYIGIEINPDYVALSERRLNSVPSPLFTTKNNLQET